MNQPEPDSSERNIWHALNTFLTGFAQLPDDGDFLWQTAERAASSLGFDDFVLYLREGPGLVQSAAFGVKAERPSMLRDPITIPIGHGIVGQAARNQHTMYIPDVSNAPGYISDHYGGKSELSVPLMAGGELVGVFDSESEHLDGFEQWQIQALESMAIAAAPRLLVWKHRRDEQKRVDRARGRQAEAIGTFAGTIAHDLNNLLAVVEFNAELLRADAANATRVESALSRVVERARVLTSRLATLTTSGPISMEILDFAELVAEAADQIESSPHVVMELDIADELPVVLGDPTQVPLLIHNIVLNAIEAIGTEPGTVTLRVYPMRDAHLWVCLDVVDDGPGVDPSIIDQLFDPYFTTKPDGVGLGLASAYWTALQHGGDLSASSSPGQGATFSLRLPGQEGRIVHSPPPKDPEDALRILVLEDDDLVALCLTEVLELSGHSHHHVSRGEEVLPAWAAAREGNQPFDVAILDIRNSLGEGGVFALEQLLGAEPDVRAIAMSGYSEQTLDEASRAGFVASLSKPFRIDDLNQALRNAIGSEQSVADPVAPQ